MPSKSPSQEDTVKVSKALFHGVILYAQNLIKCQDQCVEDIDI